MVSPPSRTNPSPSSSASQHPPPPTAEEVAGAAQQAQSQIEVAQWPDDQGHEGGDEGDDEARSLAGESGYASDDDGASETTSLGESVRAYVYENGRRYHKYCEGRYALPNDEAEQEREDLKHAMTLFVCGNKLHFAPIIDEPRRILDLGTGTGIWCIEMGESFPSADVLGIDLSPIQPPFVPPNVRFEVDDIEQEWLYREPFDFIHLRAMAPAIRNWDHVLSSAYHWLRPGAYIELQELDFYPQSDDGSLPADWAYMRYTHACRAGFERLGNKFHIAQQVAAMVRAAGFVGVVEQRIKVPLGPWAKHKLLRTAGLYMQSVAIDAFNMASNGLLQKNLGWGAAEAELLVAEARKAIRDPNVHAYYTLYIVYGQKPVV